MAIDERARHELFQRLDEVLGPDAATTLIEHLPPGGWGEVATKSDLAALAASTDAELAALESRIDARFDRVEPALTPGLGPSTSASMASMTGSRPWRTS